MPRHHRRHSHLSLSHEVGAALPALAGYDLLAYSAKKQNVLRALYIQRGKNVYIPTLRPNDQANMETEERILV